MNFQVIGLAVAVVVVFGTGFRLSRRGRPYATGWLTVHKLVDLAAVVVLGVIAFTADGEVSLPPPAWLAAGLTAALLIALFASGGVLSATQKAPTWVLWVHRVAPWLALVAGAAAAYFAAAT